MAALSAAGTLTMNVPGARPFLLSAINGLFPIHMKNSTPMILVGADRNPTRGLEPGAQLGFVKQVSDQTEDAMLVSREGAGVMGVNTMPAWSHGGAPTGSVGTTAMITKERQDFSWNINEMDGAILATGTVGDGSTSTRILSIVTMAANNRFQNLRLKFDAATATVALQGVEREIFGSDSAGFDIYPALVTVPAGPTPGPADTFTVYTRPHFARTVEYPTSLLEIDSNTAHTATIRTAEYGAVVGANNRPIHYEIGQEVPWVLSSGDFWDIAYDKSHGKYLLTNGRNGLLEYDGQRLRKLAALWDYRDGAEGAIVVQIWRGVAVDEQGNIPANPTLASADLYTVPPNARFITAFNSRIVVASTSTGVSPEQTIQWSAPDTALLSFNNLWPLNFQTTIRDAANAPITGMWTLNDRLVVSTPNSIFSSGPFSQSGYLDFESRSQSLGFVSHRGTVNVQIDSGGVLVGPTADGLSAFDGFNITTILDDWRRLVPGGVNIRRLSQCVAAYWRQRGLYILAFPTADSTTNNRALVWRVGTAKMWLWSVPFGGITAMASEVSPHGLERLLFGTADGHICTLGDGDYDGATAITGVARSHYVAFGGKTVAGTAMLLNVQDTHTTAQLTVRTYFNCSTGARQTWQGVTTYGGAAFGSAVFGTSTLGGGDFKLVRANLRAGAGGAGLASSIGEIFAYEVAGTHRFRIRAAHMLIDPKSYRGA